MLKRLFRFTFHLLMAGCLLLGITLLVFWPVNIYWGSLFLTHQHARPVSVNNPNGPWYKSTNYYIDFKGGEITISAAPNQIGVPEGPGERLLTSDGFVHKSDLSGSPLPIDAVVWDAPISGHGSFWEADFVSFGNYYFATQLWIAAIPPLLLGTAWLVECVIFPIRNRRLRMQTNLCLHCGYNLTGVESDKCPECGADRPLVTLSSGQP